MPYSSVELYGATVSKGILFVGSLPLFVRNYLCLNIIEGESANTYFNGFSFPHDETPQTSSKQRPVNCNTHSTSVSSLLSTLLFFLAILGILYDKLFLVNFFIELQ